MLGEFVLRRNGSVWTATIIDGLGLLGVGERNARQAVARLGEDGLLEAERVGRVTRWHLTPRADQLLAEGSDRIYRFSAGSGAWGRQWLVVITSIGEEDRAKRHQLRTRLGFAGFGFLAAGIAVSPHVEREEVANGILRDLDLVDAAVVFVAATGSLVPDDQIIARAWDLAELADRYRDFVAEFARRSVRTPGEGFGAVVELVHEWRRFPFDDPEIPMDLLPPGWSGAAAKATFDDRRDAWSPFADRWFDEREGKHSTTS